MQSKEHYKKISKKVFLGIGIVTIFVAGIFLGKLTTVQSSSTVLLDEHLLTLQNKEFNQFWSIWKLLNEKYPFKEKIPTDSERIHGAIAGMVDSFGDPYTMFFPPKEAKMFEEDVKGEFGGVGMEVGVKQGILTVVAPLKNSPSEKAGMQPGDMIVKINGTSSEGMTVEEAVSIIRGPIGTKVTLTIARPGTSEFMDIVIVRDTITVPIIHTEKKGSVFIISLYSFSENSATAFEKALQEFRASKSKKLIIDLRNNPGGYLDAAVDMMSNFIPQGKVVLRENQGEKEPELVYRSHGTDNPIAPGTKIIILINEGSASASEILAGAMTEHGVAQTVGTQTFGKGSVQELISLSDGSSIKITVAKWFTPNGVSISDKGITPTYVVSEKPTEKNPDPILQKALSLLGN